MLVGTIVNTITVITGSLLGMLLGEKVLPERLRDTVMKGLGLCTLYIGLTGLSGSSNALIPIISMVVGAILGELLDLDGRLNRFAQKLENRFQKEGDGRPSLAEGFVTSSLVFCVGSMTVMGALQDGLTGNHDLLFTKSILDLVSSTIFASSGYRRSSCGCHRIHCSGRYRHCCSFLGSFPGGCLYQRAQCSPY